MKTWYTNSIEDMNQEFDLTHGLSDAEVLENQAKYGKNILESSKTRSKFLRFLDQFKDVMIWVLMVAAGISFALGDRIEPIIILAIVILNALIGFVQENRAEASLQALRKLSSPYSKVIRNGKEVSIDSTEVVFGDLLILEAGDLVSSDIRLTKSSSLKIAEASLTGESLPVEKFASVVVDEDAVLGDRKNMAYSSGMVTYGRGEGIVIATGMKTEVGKIAQMLQDSVGEQTPLQKKLDSLGKKLGILAILAVGVIFVMSLLKDNDDIMDAFMMAVSLAVAVIPEGLPAVSTIVLAMGVQRLVEKNAIIRSLPSVETLGSASVICSDKTGTLTQNKMTVQEVWSQIDDHKNLMTYALLCNDARILDGFWVGDPTETALSEWAYETIGSDVLSDYPRINEVPFDSGRKRMSTIHEFEEGIKTISKGGVDEILSICTHIQTPLGVIEITDSHKQEILNANETMASKALRVLAFAIKDLKENPKEGDMSVESHLTFVGLVGMIDPPRPEVFDAINICKKAGIRTVMITGDHAITAEAIAQEIGLLEDYRVVTGQDLDKMSDEDLIEVVQDIGVYARVSPEDKMRIINAWKTHGHIVAMTGDGVNDAPALKRADIGAAMGIVGTEVAKGASDMVLTDDNFATVVTAIKEGRRIKDNILKAISYLLSCNVGELLTLLIAVLFSLGTPLVPIHILWVNLVTDSLPALALGVDPEEEGIMNRKPDLSLELISKSGLWRIGYQGAMIGTLTLIAYLVGLKENIVVGQTMAFSVLALSQLVHSYNIHSPHASVFKTFFKNKWLVLATLINALMMLAVLLVPALRTIFGLSILNTNQWLLIAALIIVPIPLVEFMKLMGLNGKD